MGGVPIAMETYGYLGLKGWDKMLRLVSRLATEFFPT